MPIWSALLVWLCLAPAPRALQGDPTGDVPDRFGAPDGTLSMREARAAAFDADGWLYIAGDSRIQVFDTALEPVGGWGSRGGGAGQLRRPGGLAVADDGTLFVADTGNHQIQLFAPDGTWLDRWGERGAGKLGLLRPRGLALSEVRVFVADEGNDRVQVLGRMTGRHLDTWTGAVDGRDGLLRPSGLARDESGRVFVADAGNHRVMVFARDGERLATLGERGPFPGLFAAPSGLACHAGRLYVADRENHRIQVFDVEAVLAGRGEPLYEWGKHAIRPREGNGRMHYPDAIAVAPDGSRAVVCEGFVDRAQLFGPATGAVEEYAADPTLRSGIAPHYGPSIATGSGRLLLIEPESQSVLVLAATDAPRDVPVLIHRLGDWGVGFGKHQQLADVTFGPARAVVTDRNAGRIQTWRLDETADDPPVFVADLSHLVHAVDVQGLLDREGWPRAADAPRAQPGAVAANAEWLFVVDEASPRVLAFDHGWSRAEVFATDDLHTPVDLAMGPAAERLYVADAAQAAVFVYALHGQGTRSGSGDGAASFEPSLVGTLSGGLREPAGVAVSPQGTVFVTDLVRHEVLVFDTRGKLLTRFGGEGLGAGELFKPRGIACLPEGRLVVVDHGNHRGQLFTEDGGFLGAFGSRLYVEAARRDGTGWLEEEQ